jgi:hypothetical protein
MSDNRLSEEDLRRQLDRELAEAYKFGALPDQMISAHFAVENVEAHPELLAFESTRITPYLGLMNAGVLQWPTVRDGIFRFERAPQ